MLRGHRGPGEAGAPRAVARRECGLVPLWAQRSPVRTPAAPSWVGGGKPAGHPSPSTATSESSPAPTPPPSFPSRKPSWPTSSGSAWLARQGVPGGMRQWGPAKGASGGAGFQPVGQGTDPHLCIADEEQLLVGQLQSWQQLVLAAFRHPLQVSLQAPSGCWARACPPGGSTRLARTPGSLHWGGREVWLPGLLWWGSCPCSVGPLRTPGTIGRSPLPGQPAT